MAKGSSSKKNIITLLVLAVGVLLTVLAVKFVPAILNQHAAYSNAYQSCLNTEKQVNTAYLSCETNYQTQHKYWYNYKHNCLDRGPGSYGCYVPVDQQISVEPKDNCVAQTGIAQICSALQANIHSHYATPHYVNPQSNQTTTTNRCGCMYTAGPSKSYNYTHCDCGIKNGSTCTFTYVRNAGRCP